MDEHMQIDVVIIVGQKVKRKWRRKNLPYITLKDMSFAEYDKSQEIILSNLEMMAKQLHNAGYTMYFRGE